MELEDKTVSMRGAFPRQAPQFHQARSCVFPRSVLSDGIKAPSRFFLFFPNIFFKEPTIISSNMAEVAERETPQYDVSYARQLKDLAMGVHPLARYVPPLLLLADAVLCTLVIWKISCNDYLFLRSYLFYLTIFSCVPILTSRHRHGNRLESLHGANRTVHSWRARLHQDQGRYRTAGVSSCACLYLLDTILCYAPWEEHPARAGDIWGFVFGNSGFGYELL